jgi:hypothetical protein
MICQQRTPPRIPPGFLGPALAKYPYRSPL